MTVAPEVAGLAMALSSVSVVLSSLALKSFRRPVVGTSGKGSGEVRAGAGARAAPPLRSSARLLSEAAESRAGDEGAAPSILDLSSLKPVCGCACGRCDAAELSTVEAWDAAIAARMGEAPLPRDGGEAGGAAAAAGSCCVKRAAAGAEAASSEVAAAAAAGAKKAEKAEKTAAAAAAAARVPGAVCVDVDGGTGGSGGDARSGSSEGCGCAGCMCGTPRSTEDDTDALLAARP
jgi:hypothetical protein